MKNTGASIHAPRAAGIILLLVHLVLQMHGLPLFAAAFAALSGGHRVELVQGQVGLCLVLHHDRSGTEEDSLPPQHHHRGLMRLLAGDDSEGPHPDHWLQFTSSPSQMKTSETGLSVDEVSHEPVSSDHLPFPTVLAAGAAQTVPESYSRRHYWWPPAPAECPWGFVVLLI